MKRFRLLPSILMLVLCTAVLAVGIYAASPTSHSVVGTINISAGGANVSITGYLDDGDGDYTDDVKVTDTYTSRTSQTISIYANALDFDCSSASDISEVAEKKLYFKVQNHSNFSLGAYFLEGTVPESGTTIGNIAETKNFNGTTGTETITNLVTATFTTYSEVPVNGSTYMYSKLKLNQINSEESTVTLRLNLNIERFNESLKPSAKNSILVENTSDVSISVNCAVENAGKESTQTITDSGSWCIGVLEFSEEIFSGQLRLQAVKAKMLIKNNGSSPISASLVATEDNAEQDSTKIKVTVLNNPYIASGATGEVSIQFAAIYDRGTAAPTAPTINTYSYKAVVNNVDTAQSLISRVKYDDDSNGTMPSRGYNYYVEFGDNPYYTTGSTTQRQKLRWYIWAKDNGSGVATRLVAGIDYNETTHVFIGGGKYFFISENELDISNSQLGISYNNEYYDNTQLNLDGKYASDYAGSNIRKYLNGVTVKDCFIEDGKFNKHANGENVNFYERYKLTEDVLFSQITERSLQDMYKGNTYSSDTNTLLEKYAQESDKFWAITYSDCYCLAGVSSDSDLLFDEEIDLNIGSVYWIQSGFGAFAFRITASGYLDAVNVAIGSNNLRPCFILTI